MVMMKFIASCIIDVSFYLCGKLTSVEEVVVCNGTCEFIFKRNGITGVLRLKLFIVLFGICFIQK